RSGRLVVGLLVAVVGLAVAGQAWAAVTPGWECIPTTAGQPVVSGGKGAAPSCGAGTTAVLAPTYLSSGVGGKPTVQFAAVNVQIVSGSGATDGAVNGKGNLVIGYDENPAGRAQTGSHDLILGERNSWTGYAELVSGYNDTAKGSYAATLGASNSASGTYATVTGGLANAATGTATGVSGGFHNIASASFTSVSGGCSNLAGTGSITIN